MQTSSLHCLVKKEGHSKSPVGKNHWSLVLVCFFRLWLTMSWSRRAKVGLRVRKRFFSVFNHTNPHTQRKSIIVYNHICTTHTHTHPHTHSRVLFMRQFLSLLYLYWNSKENPKKSLTDEELFEDTFRIILLQYRPGDFGCFGGASNTRSCVEDILVFIIIIIMLFTEKESQGSLDCKHCVFGVWEEKQTGFYLKLCYIFTFRS